MVVLYTEAAHVEVNNFIEDISNVSFHLCFAPLKPVTFERASFFIWDEAFHSILYMFRSYL